MGLSGRKYDTVVIGLATVIITAIALYHDIFRHYLSSADADFIYVYQALLFNDGLSQAYFDHTGYVYFLILTGWIKALYWLGIVGAERLGELTGRDAFEPLFAELVYAGRWLSIVLVTAFAVCFYYGVRFLTDNRHVAAAAAIVLAFSPGMVAHSLVMRTGLPAMLFVVMAFFMLIAAIRARGWREIWLLVAVGFFCMIAMMAKMQVIFLLLALPGLALAFGERGQPVVGPNEDSHLRWLAAAFVAAAIAFAIPAAAMIVGRIAVKGTGLYQALIAIYVVGSIFVYGHLFRRTVRDSVLCAAAMVAGIALGQYFNFVYHDIGNTDVLANFVEHMAPVAGMRDLVSTVLYQESIVRFLGYLGSSIQGNYLTFELNRLPAHLVYWYVAVGGAVALQQKSYRLAIQCGLLLGVALGMEAFCRLRYYPTIYYIFVVPWILIAAALLTDALLRHVRSRNGLGVRATRNLVAVPLAAAAILISGLWLNQALAKRSWNSPASFACKRDASGELRPAKHEYTPLLQGYLDKYCVKK